MKTEPILNKFAPARKPKTRAEMVAYLEGHFRYDTMNSWNRATSYAHNVKIGNPRSVALLQWRQV